MKTPAVATAVRNISGTGGGVAEVARAVHRGLKAADDQGHVLLAGWGAHAQDFEFDIGRYGRQARQVLVKCRPEVVHIHGIWTSFEQQVRAAARRVGANVVFSPHGSLEPTAMASKAWKKRLAWLSYQKRHLLDADLLVVNSDQECRSLRRLGLNGPIAIIPNGVDLSHFPENQAYTALSQREPVVLYLGRLSALKGLPDLLRAWQQLPDRNGFELHIHGYGEPTFSAELRRLVCDLAIGQSVKLLPALYGEDKWRKYMGSSVFVLPSKSENFGVTVAEALFCGMPVVTTVNAPWQDVQNQNLGWVVPAEPDALQHAISSAIALSDGQRLDLAARAHQYVSERFLWPALIEQYRTTYRWLTDGGTIPPWVIRS